MSDLLHPSIHALLSEAESYVALPVLLVIGLCTLQFVFCQTCQIATTVSDIMKRKSDCKPKRKSKCPPGPSLMDRLKGMFCRKPDKCKKTKSSKRTFADIMSEKKYDEWDDNDEYDEEEEIEDELLDDY